MTRRACIARDDIERTAERARSIQGRSCAALDLNGSRGRGDRTPIRPIHRVGFRIVCRNAVDEHLDIVLIETADEELCFTVSYTVGGIRIETWRTLQKQRSILAMNPLVNLFFANICERDRRFALACAVDFDDYFAVLKHR